MIDGFQMIGHPLPSDGHAFQHDLRFSQGEAVALDGVGVVRPADDQIVAQVPHDGRIERPPGIEPGLQEVEFGDVHEIRRGRIGSSGRSDSAGAEGGACGHKILAPEVGFEPTT